MFTTTATLRADMFTTTATLRHELKRRDMIIEALEGFFDRHGRAAKGHP